MAQQIVDSKVGTVGIGDDKPGLSAEDNQLQVPVKKIPLRDLPSENNIVPKKGYGNPLVLKDAVIIAAAKLSGTKRASPESQMNTHQQSMSVTNGNGANGHLVYVRRKSDIESGKTSNNEVAADNAQSPPPRQHEHQDDRLQPKSLIDEAPQAANLPILTSTMSIPSGNPTIPTSLGILDAKVASEEPRTQTAPSPIRLSAEAGINKQNWEERYIHLQMYLKKVDQSSLEDHLRALRSLSAAELSRHAVELEKRAIQLSLEQGKELQRVKSLNVLGKALRTPIGPSLQQTLED